jgi:glucose-6-phosphate 1-dehydrogenase
VIDQSSSTTIVIFGASGDLTRRKLVPALFRLCSQGRLPARFNVVGFAVTEWDTAEFRRQMRGGVDEFAREPFSEAAWDFFSERLHYATGGFTDAADFTRLEQLLNDITLPHSAIPLQRASKYSILAQCPC